MQYNENEAYWEENVMPWCPVCKNEYVAGIKVCADCNVELVDELDEMKAQPIIFGTEDEMNRLNQFLQYNHLNSGMVQYNEEDGTYELLVASEDMVNAKKIAAIFHQQEALSKQQEKMNQGQDIEDISDMQECIAADTNVGTGTNQGTGNHYENKKDKAENFKTSAYTLITVGILGAVLLLLCYLQVIPFHLNTLSNFVMALLFGIFIIVGISSYRSYRNCAKDAVVEERLRDEVKKWCLENLTGETVDAELFQNETTEEMKYFKRMDKMKGMISDTFLNLEDGFLESILEELYTEIFEEK